MLERKTKYNIKDRIDVLMRKAQMGDWFLIFLLSNNLDSIMFKEFIDRFTDILKTEGGPTEDILEGGPTEDIIERGPTEDILESSF